MNWEAVVAVSEIIGTVTVIASLLFVGIQLRQSGSIEKANAQRNLLEQLSNWVGLASSDPLVFNAVRDCLHEYDSAEPIVKERFNAWAWKVLLIVEQAIYMDNDGFITESSLNGMEQGMLSILNTKEGWQWWALTSNIVGSEVSTHLQQRLEETKGTIPPWNELFPHLALQFGGAEASAKVS